MTFFEQAEKFTQDLKDHFSDQLVSVVLFGSVARNSTTDDSDIDLWVVLEGLPKSRYQRRLVLEPLFNEFEKEGIKTPVNCHLKTPTEAKHITLLHYDLAQEGILLYDKQDFMLGILKGVKKRIQQMGAQKRKRGKFTYWDLKPGAKSTDTFEVL